MPTLQNASFESGNASAYPPDPYPEDGTSVTGSQEGCPYNDQGSPSKGAATMTTTYMLFSDLTKEAQPPEKGILSGTLRQAGDRSHGWGSPPARKVGVGSPARKATLLLR